MSHPSQPLSPLLPMPDAASLHSVLDFLRKQRGLSATNRRSGDEANQRQDLEQAIEAWQQASAQNLHALAGARSYYGFRELFDKDGNPVSGRNYPLQGEEAEFAKLYCDTLGRQGGLFRRLGNLEKAGEHYHLGSLIEARSADLGFENSYNTLNAISIMIEMGRSSASPLRANLPNLRSKILAARDMVKDQIFEGRRANDGWAKSDLALAIMLSDDPRAVEQDVPIYYARYAAQADVDDIETTLRILKLLFAKLSEMGDPVADLIKRGIDILREAALKVDKKVQ
jgi:tetratricopeptide (TPR) repeat protein